MEAIAQAQAEDQQMVQQQIFTSSNPVPSAVIGRALTSGGNTAYSIERIVAFFQKSPTASAAASFMAKEFGEGGKGVKIAKQDYALWFDKEGFRIAPGRSAFGPGSTLVTWVNAAVMVLKHLRDGIFAKQEKIDGAQDNEYRELAAKLWSLRQDFSDSAKERNYLPTISQHYFNKGFPDDTKEITELLKDPASRQQIVQEMAEFVGAHDKDRSLLRFNRIHNPQDLFANIVNLFTPPEQFKAVEDFAPAKASFITEDEINRLLMRGGNISEGKLRIYSYFKQGHDAKECAKFLRQEYGDGGHCYQGYNEDHGSKGIRLTRSDEGSGFDGYDTVRLNWNQVQKRIRELIDSGRYLNQEEQNHLPQYEKERLAYSISDFFRNVPNEVNSDEWDAKTILPLLDDPIQTETLFNRMLDRFAPLSPDTPHYAAMQFALRDAGMYQRGESTYFSPLPEAALQAERRIKQAATEAKKAEKAQRTSPAPNEPEGTLAAAARALGKKMQPQVTEDDEGQISFDLFSSPATEPSVPSSAQERTSPSTPDPVSAYNAIKEANPDSIVLYQVGDFFEIYFQ